MCPACIASTAVLVAGTGSTGGLLAVCLAQFKDFSERIVLVCFRRRKEK